MGRNVAKGLSWLIGLLALALLVWYFKPYDFVDLISSVGLEGIAIWVVLTLIARVVRGETTVAPMRAIGLQISRLDVFYIGWLRTFASQVLPMSGVAAYAQALRTKTGISWSQLAAIATPQYILAATALGIVGTIAVLLNGYSENRALLLLLVLYCSVVLASLAIIRGSTWMLKMIPTRIAERVKQASETLRQLLEENGLVPRLIAYHVIVILFRGARLWALFGLAGVQLSVQEALLLVSIAESSMLIQLTPGGLGLREGAIVGGASLLGISADIAMGVAVIDRLLVLGMTALLMPPSALALRSASQDHREK